MKNSNESETRRRAVVYVVGGLALAALVAFVQGRVLAAPPAAHRLVELAAALVAAGCSVVALLRHFGRRERHFLFVGLTFLGVAAFDGFEVLALVRSGGSPIAAAAAGWGWIASRLFLSLFLARLALLPRHRSNGDLELDETTVYASATLLAAIGLSVLLLAPLPPPGPIGTMVGHVVPGALLAMALFLNLRRGVWQTNVFEHGLIGSLLLGTGAQMVAAAAPFQPDSAVLLVARCLKVLSYGAVFAALLASVFLTYRALEETGRALAVAHRSLEREITDRKATERELQIRTAFLEHLFESTPEAIVVLDREDRVQRINAEFTRLFGYAPNEALGRPIGSLIVPLDRAGEADNFSEDVARGSTVSAETVRRRSDGSVVDVSILGTPILVADGQIGVFGIYRDITDRKRAEAATLAAKAAAEDANRSKSEFLASMSHELRTPLNSVIGFTRVLLKNKGGTLGANELRYLDRIGANGEHLLTLINNILDLSKVEAGMLQTEIAETDLVELLRDTALQLEGRVTGGPIALRAELPDGVLPVATDAHRLRQVIINLVGNALKFTNEGEVVVSLETDHAGQPVRIDVTDTGIGIAADRLSFIFEAFEQADRSTARQYGGTGLGLSISRGICRELGYDLTVRSVPGVGSTFSIVLNGSAVPDPMVEAGAVHA